MKWTEQHTLKFVQEYIKYECLYNVKCAEFENKQLRDATLLKLSEAMEILDFGPKEAYNKIRSLKSTFSQEHKKVKDSMKSGAGLDDIYVPNIKWYKVMDDALKAVNLGECSETSSNMAAPAIICEIKNGFDSDGAILDVIDNNRDQDFVIDDNSNKQTSVLIDTIDILDTNEKFDSEELTNFEVQDIFGTNSPQIVDAQKSSGKSSAPVIKITELLRRPTDYVRREAVIRIKHLENKKKMEMHILRTQLEVEEIKKKAALLELERNKILLEKAKIELEEVKKSNLEK